MQMFANRRAFCLSFKVLSYDRILETKLLASFFVVVGILGIGSIALKTSSNMQQRHRDRKLYFNELANTSREFYID